MATAAAITAANANGRLALPCPKCGRPFVFFSLAKARDSIPMARAMTDPFILAYVKQSMLSLSMCCASCEGK